MFSISIKL